MKRIIQSFMSLLGLGALAAESGNWLVGTTEQDGLRVVIKIVDEMPPDDVREKYRWLTVISWTYDRSARNGMPPTDINKQMIALEDVIDGLGQSGLHRDAYSRTGNGVKEFAIYIADRERFMAAFNEALVKHPRYPLEINFYEDVTWMDYQAIRKLFEK